MRSRSLYSQPNKAWRSVTTPDSCPEIRGGEIRTLSDREVFEQELPKPIAVCAIRPLDKPGKGTRADKGRSSSCAGFTGDDSDQLILTPI